MCSIVEVQSFSTRSSCHVVRNTSLWVGPRWAKLEAQSRFLKKEICRNINWNHGGARNWCQKHSRNDWNPFWKGEKPNNSMWLKYSAGRCVAAALSSGCWMVSFSGWQLPLFGSRPAWSCIHHQGACQPHGKANIECASTLAQDCWVSTYNRRTWNQPTCSSCRPRQMEVVCWQILDSGNVFWCWLGLQERP